MKHSSDSSRQPPSAPTRQLRFRFHTAGITALLFGVAMCSVVYALGYANPLPSLILSELGSFLSATAINAAVEAPTPIPQGPDAVKATVLFVVSGVLPLFFLMVGGGTRARRRFRRLARQLVLVGDEEARHKGAGPAAIEEMAEIAVRIPMVGLVCGIMWMLLWNSLMGWAVSNYPTERMPLAVAVGLVLVLLLSMDTMLCLSAYCARLALLHGATDRPQLRRTIALAHAFKWWPQMLAPTVATLLIAISAFAFPVGGWGEVLKAVLWLLTAAVILILFLPSGTRLWIWIQRAARSDRSSINAPKNRLRKWIDSTMEALPSLPASLSQRTFTNTKESDVGSKPVNPPAALITDDDSVDSTNSSATAWTLARHERRRAVQQVARLALHQNANDLNILHAYAEELGPTSSLADSEKTEVARRLAAMLTKMNGHLSSLRRYMQPAVAPRERLSLRRLVASAVYIVQAEQEHALSPLKLTGTEEDGAVFGSRVELLLVLTTLLRTALLAPGATSPLRLVLSSDDATVQLCLRGVDQRALDPYATTPSERGGRVPDSGFDRRMDAAIVHEVLRDHGGELVVTAEADTECSAALTLPRAVST